MANIFQAVQTYNKTSMPLLVNQLVFASNANNKFREFNTDVPQNLGSTVTGDLPPRFYSNDGLVVNQFDGVEQRVFDLTVDKSKNVNFSVTNEEEIFNMDPMDYMDVFGRSAVAELASAVEQDIATTILDHTYRFYGDGITPINSVGQLAKSYAQYRDFGAPAGVLRNFLDINAIPGIVDTSLNQFVLDRNKEYANSWELGTWNGVEHYSSNMLAVHTAGTVGNAQTTLTVVSTVGTGTAIDPITAIVFSGAGTDADAIKRNDLMRFLDGVSGQPNIRFRRWTGHGISNNPVQLRATADASSSADSVTVQIYPYLQWEAGKNQNLSINIAAGMQVKFVPSHRRGALIGGNALYVAMPRLPNQTPYPVSSIRDEESKIGLRMTYGAILGKATQGIIYDVIWGKTLIDEYAQAYIYPL